MNFKYFNYEYFWCEENYIFKRKNIILKNKIINPNELPIIKHEEEPELFNNSKTLNKRIFYLHPKMIIKSPISLMENYFFVLTGPYFDLKKENPISNNQILFSYDDLKPIPFNIFFNIRQKVKCTFPDKKNNFYIQKIIDEIIFSLTKIEMPLTQIYFDDNIESLVYFLTIDNSLQIFVFDTIVKYVIEKVLNKYNINNEYLPKTKYGKNNEYLWTIQFPILNSLWFPQIKETIVKIFEDKDGVLVQKENKRLENNPDEEPIDFITIKTNYSIFELQNIFSNLDNNPENNIEE